MAGVSRIVLRRISDKDRGGKSLVARLGKLGDLKVKVGIYGAAADETHQGTEASNVDVASVHEFGAGPVPERSFIRATVDGDREEIQSVQRRLTKGVVDGKATEDQALRVLGEHVRNLMQERIRKNIPPPLQPGTIQKKGSSTALIDSAQMIGSIAYEVTKK